jgi:hypothetical protein
MSGQLWQETLVAGQTDSVQILNSTAQASCIPPHAKFTLPAGFFSTIGKTVKLNAQGRISCVVTTPGTLLFQVLFGATAVYNNAAAAMNLNIVAKTDVAWWLEIVLTCRSISNAGATATATLMGQGQWTSEAVVGSPLPTAGGAGTLFIPASAPAVSPTFDPSVAQVVDLQAKFSVATATTALTTHQFKLESLN